MSDLEEEYKKKKQRKLAEWEQLKKSEDADTYGLTHEPIITAAFEKMLNDLSIPPDDLIHEYITFSIGFHAATRLMCAATGAY